jgi:hypothetical protein
MSRISSDGPGGRLTNVQVSARRASHSHSSASKATFTGSACHTSPAPQAADVAIVRFWLLLAKISSYYLRAHIDEVGTHNLVVFPVLLKLLSIHVPAPPVSTEPFPRVSQIFQRPKKRRIIAKDLDTRRGQPVGAQIPAVSLTLEA